MYEKNIVTLQPEKIMPLWLRKNRALVAKKLELHETPPYHYCNLFALHGRAGG